MTERLRQLLLAILLTTVSLGSAWAGLAKPLMVDDEPSYPLAGHILLLHDPGGAMSLERVEAAYRAGQFRPARSAIPGLGYHRGAWWVRFELQNVSDLTQARWLEQDWPFQQSMNLYLRGADGSLSLQRNGGAVPIAERPLKTKQPLYRVTLAPGEHLTGYLRLSGPAASVVDLTLWQPEAYADHSRIVMALRYLSLSSLMALLVFSLMAWQARGSWLLLMGGLANLLLIVLMMFVDGLLSGYLPLDENLWQSRASSVLLMLFIGAHIAFANEFLDTRFLYPRLSRAMNLAALSSPLAALYFVLVLSQQLALICHALYITFLIGCSVYIARNGSRKARIYLVAWGIMWLFFLLRSLALQGYLPGVSFSMDLPLIGIALTSLTLSYALFIDIRGLRQEADLARSRLIAHQRDEQQRLLEAVEERTRELEAAKQNAEQASQAKSDFISVINHELRTPLHTILGYTHLLAKESPQTLSDKIGIIEKSGTQLLRLIDDVLVYSRGEVRVHQPSPAPLSLSELALRLEQSFHLQPTHGNRLQLELDPQLPPVVEADEQALTQVLQNLLGNACKFTEQGCITLRMAQAGPERPDGRVAVLFSVQDTGIGIAPEILDKIFEPFSRADASRHQPGVGLGLSIVRNLVRSMGGEIRVQSTPGLGSRFSFELLFKLGEAAEISAGAVEARPEIIGYQPPRRTLLIADDIRENRDFLQALCTLWGFECVLAGDGEQALQACLDPAARIDAVLLDQFMPVLDGWSFLRRLRALPQFDALPVILVSAAPAQPPEDDNAYPEFDAVLMKPIRPEDLARTLQRLLRLEWRFAAPRATAAEPLVPPPEQEMTAMRDALALGRLPLLKRQAEALQASHPQCAAFAREVLQRCRAVDLKGLQQLLAGAGNA